MKTSEKFVYNPYYYYSFKLDLQLCAICCDGCLSVLDMSPTLNAMNSESTCRQMKGILGILHVSKIFPVCVLIGQKRLLRWWQVPIHHGRIFESYNTVDILYNLFIPKHFTICWLVPSEDRGSQWMAEKELYGVLIFMIHQCIPDYLSTTLLDNLNLWDLSCPSLCFSIASDDTSCKTFKMENNLSLFLIKQVFGYCDDHIK